MALAPSTSFLLLVFLHFHLLLLVVAESSCPTSFDCQNFGSLQFPLSNVTRTDCGLFTVNCTIAPHNPLIQLAAEGTWYEVLNIISPNKFRIRDCEREKNLLGKNCHSFRNLSLPNNPSTSFTISPNLTMVKCLKGHVDEGTDNKHFLIKDCPDFTIYYRNPANSSAINESALPSNCGKVQLPGNPLLQHDSSDLFSLLTANFTLEWNISHDCMSCHERGGQCDTNSMNEFGCFQDNHRQPSTAANPSPGPSSNAGRSRIDSLRLALAICGGVLILVFVIVSVVLWLCKKRIKDLYLLSRKKSAEPPSPKPGIIDNGGSFYYNIPIFSNSELEEATDNFDPSKELGDGGFGTVYHGILKDGREVAIKRLYEKNYKRVEQFMNEIKILTCLKHQNLVTLYGCTSRRSRELLLVYEYIPNGTVADHIHGDRAKETTLPWSIRMNIAIETASALAYLHKSDIVHRDVKTNNILLDNNFCVKVADFGLSRLFPTDVTHISTAPQGTPGYVDPEYHQCYQLTEKSDVYSFGVVLVELISSMPAVDITRHKYEINLANLALNRIQNCAFDELIDASLGYKTDPEIMRMTTSVAELAFQCLQLEKDMRPSMHEVLIFLKEFKKGSAGKIPPSPETDEVGLLENKELQSSPVAVTDAWNSGSTTSSIV